MEYHLCGQISREDLTDYAEMQANLEEDADISELVNFLSRYGKDVKEIQKTIDKHLSECLLCKTAYEDLYEKSLEYHRMGKLLRRDSPLSQVQMERRKIWLFEHFTYADSKRLKSYLSKKAVAEARKKGFELNNDFEEHIKGCNYCQDFYRSNVHILEMTLNKD
jgi:hypothetical protein